MNVSVNETKEIIGDLYILNVKLQQAIEALKAENEMLKQAVRRQEGGESPRETL